MLLTKLNKSNAVEERNGNEFLEGVRNDYEPGKRCDHERVKVKVSGRSLIN